MRRPRYRSFTDAFRGPEDRVREIQRAYVSLLKATRRCSTSGAAVASCSTCWRSAGRAEGVDSDAGMVEHCHSKGHDQVVLADGNAT